MEIDRIKKAYEKRELLEKSNRYSLFNKSFLFFLQEREREILDILFRFNIKDLSDKKVLELGCGAGAILRDFLRYGAKPENCYGIDLLLERIETAKWLSPNIDFRCVNAEKMPYESDCFDIVLSITVFSSIMDANMKKNIAEEMLRVLKDNGVILWFDYYVNNPQNNDVRGIKKVEVERLFSNCNIYLKRITLAPPLVRLIAPYSWLFCHILSKVKLLNTHYIGIISKKDQPAMHLISGS
jgi:ubiquinone/menaquinone biosynthesis C-methylase UbiE